MNRGGFLFLVKTPSLNKGASRSGGESPSSREAGSAAPSTPRPQVAWLGQVMFPEASLEGPGYSCGKGMRSLSVALLRSSAL